MSNLMWIYSGIVLWVAFSTFALIKERQRYLKQPSSFKEGDPLKLWWLYYFWPILYLIIAPLGIYGEWRQRRRWLKEYRTTGKLFWLAFEPQLRRRIGLGAELLEVAKLAPPKDPIDYAFRWFIATHIPGGMGVRVSRYVGIFEHQNRFYVIRLHGADPLLLYSIDLLMSPKCARTYPLSVVVESYLERHDTERFQPITYP